MTDAYKDRQRAVRAAGTAASSTLGRLMVAQGQASAIESEVAQGDPAIDSSADLQNRGTDGPSPPLALPQPAPAAPNDGVASSPATVTAEPQAHGNAPGQNAVLPQPAVAPTAPHESAPAAPQRESAPAAPPQLREVHTQAITIFRDDFELLKDIAYHLERRRQIRNPRHARFGPSHVIGAIVHHMLGTWDTNPEAIEDLVRAYMTEWAARVPEKPS